MRDNVFLPPAGVFNGLEPLEEAVETRPLPWSMRYIYCLEDELLAVPVIKDEELMTHGYIYCEDAMECAISLTTITTEQAMFRIEELGWSLVPLVTATQDETYGKAYNVPAIYRIHHTFLGLMPPHVSITEG